MSYPGSKGGSGVAERIISMMPAHNTYIEGFLGMGAVFKKKRRAAHSILIDLAPSVIAAWMPALSPSVALWQLDAIDWIMPPPDLFYTSAAIVLRDLKTLA